MEEPQGWTQTSLERKKPLPWHGAIFCWVVSSQSWSMVDRPGLTSWKYLQWGASHLRLVGKKSLLGVTEGIFGETAIGHAVELDGKLAGWLTGCGRNLPGNKLLTGVLLDRPWGSHLGSPPSPGLPHTCPATGARTENPPDPGSPSFLQSPTSVLYWPSLTFCQESRKEASFIRSREMMGSWEMEGNKFLNATAGNNHIWGEKLVDEAQMWERSSLFTINLCVVWFGGGILRNSFNALYWVPYYKIIMLLMIVIC